MLENLNKWSGIVFTLSSSFKSLSRIYFNLFIYYYNISNIGYADS